MEGGAPGGGGKPETFNHKIKRNWKNVIQCQGKSCVSLNFSGTITCFSML